MSETEEKIEIDGEQWEISLEETIWIGHGLEPQNRGCIVSAHNRDALINGIPDAREKHRMASVALGMENVIVRAFAELIASNQVNAYRKSEDYAERQEKLLQIKGICSELWPWIFEEKRP